jgi:aspartate/methionine/tyrosine aminotransferase
MKEILDLSWGCPVVVRQALQKTLGRTTPLVSRVFNGMGYTPHNGSPKLIAQLKNQTKRQTGWDPKFIYITHGATGGVNAALYALKDYNVDYVVTNRRYFPFYRGMIQVSGLIQIDRLEKNKYLGFGVPENSFIELVDCPSNPEGIVNPFIDADIFDGAYCSLPYNVGKIVPRKWKIYVGSLSKTLGLSGLRIGWVATDDEEVARDLERFIAASYIGLSTLSMDVAEEVLNTLDQDQFETKAASYLDSNREEMQKIQTKFGQGEVPVRGMFTILQLGKVERKALEKANIKWQIGSTWGEDDTWARLSLGQTRELTKAAVKATLK